MTRSRSETSWTSEYWSWAGVALFLLLSVDLLTSLYAAASVGIEHESNPSMVWLLTRSTPTIVGVHLAAGGLLIVLFYGLSELVEETPEPHRERFKRGIEAFLGVLIAVGLFVFANNLVVIVYGRSLL